MYRYLANQCPVHRAEHPPALPGLNDKSLGVPRGESVLRIWISWTVVSHESLIDMAYELDGQEGCSRSIYDGTYR
jgi:hypothetical protein